MKKNIALGERFIRMVVGVVLLILVLAKDMAYPWNYIVLGLSIVLMITALIGTCLMYRLFGIDTRQFKEGDEIY
jgi:hypothetical protein